jgi:integrase
VESPARLIKWHKVPRKNRQLFTSSQLELLCQSAKEKTVNHQLFCDFVRFLCFSGARIGEAMPLSWADVDFSAEQVVIGRDGDTKNREFRVVDFNPSLRAHLQAMRKRRTQELWLFPSAQRGRKGEHSESIRESLLLARAHAKLQHVRFHDCRHHFISYCVMSGIDFMTIAKWVGHKDGGMLIGRTYGHLSNEHTQRAAQKLSFG